MQIENTKGEATARNTYNEKLYEKLLVEVDQLREEHHLKMKILQKELEEKENLVQRNNEEHKIKLKLLAIEAEKKEFELKVLKDNQFH